MYNDQVIYIMQPLILFSGFLKKWFFMIMIFQTKGLVLYTVHPSQQPTQSALQAVTMYRRLN